MQGWKGCDQLSSNQTVLLTDVRDNNRYQIVKLSNGYCWMTQNLRLEDKTINKSDSDITETEYYVPKSKIGADNFNEYNKPFVWVDSNVDYGGPYSWNAATAGEKISRASSRDASQSICPHQWKLPNKSEAEKIINGYNYSSVQQSPLRLSATGVIPANETGVDHLSYCYKLGRSICPDTGSRISHWWTATTVENKLAVYAISVYSAYQNPNSGSTGIVETADDGKFSWQDIRSGFNIRCIYRP